MNNVIRFETQPIDFRDKYESYLPNSKYWNKLLKICKNRIKIKAILPDRNIDDELFIREMNDMVILRNTGLLNLPKRLEGKEFIETDYILPAGQRNGRRVIAQYFIVSKKYILVEYRKEKDKEYLKVAKYKRLDALNKGKRVKIYDIEIQNSNLKIINAVD